MPRKTNMYKRPDGRWCHEYYLGIVNGKQKRQFLYGTTQAEVRAKIAELDRIRAGGANLIDGNVALHVYLKHWLDIVMKPKIAVRTYERYKHDIDTYINPIIGSILLRKLSRQHVELMLSKAREHRSKRTNKPLSARSIRNIHATLRAALNDARPTIAINVAATVSVSTTSDFQASPLTITQSQKFLEIIAGHRLEVLFLMLILLGVRKGEVLGALWSDLDIESLTWTISGSLQRVNERDGTGGKLVRGRTKTPASKTAIPVPVYLMEAILQHRIRQQEEGFYDPKGYVFVSEVGTPLEPTGINRRLDGFLKKAGLEHIRVHDLRHTCGALLASRGVSQRTIMGVLRHTQMSTTTLYTQVADETRRNALEGLDAALSGRVLELPPRRQRSSGEEPSGR